MKYTVEICSFDKVPEEYKESVSNNGAGKEWASYLIVRYKGKVVQCESSAMEPEDVSFYRDLKWVKTALLEAYATGFEDGRNIT